MRYKIAEAAKVKVTKKATTTFAGSRINKDKTIITATGKPANNSIS